MKKILMTLTLLVAMAVSAVAANYVTVTGTSVRLRMKPSMQSETLTNAKGENIHPKKGQKLECLADAGDFYKVKYQGKVVYISKQFARIDGEVVTTKASTATAGQRYVIVDGTDVRLRLQPSLSAKTLQRGGVNVHPKKGERIKYMGESGSFYKVNFQGNYVYIYKDYAHIEK